MSQKPHLVLEGSYNYLKNGNIFSQEQFRVVHLQEENQFHLYSDINSRIETGEFLKISVKYEMNDHGQINFIKVDKTLGALFTQETFSIDKNTSDLTIKFKSGSGEQDFKRSFNIKHILTTPSVAGVGLFTLTKKLELLQRVPIVTLNSINTWQYEGPPTEKLIFVELIHKETDELVLNNTQLTSTYITINQNDRNVADTHPTAHLYLSKHFGIPYLLQHEDLRVEIQYMKKY